MTVSGISSTISPSISPSTRTGGGVPVWPGAPLPTLDPVTAIFGVQLEQLDAELQTRQLSLAAFAQSKGVSVDDLVSAIRLGLQLAWTNSGRHLTDAEANDMARAIATSPHHSNHRRTGEVAAVGSTSSGSGSSGPTGDHRGGTTAHDGRTPLVDIVL